MAISRLPGIHRKIVDADIDASSLTSRVMSDGVIDSSRLESPNFIKTGFTTGIPVDTAGWKSITHILSPGFPTTIDEVLYSLHFTAPPSGLRIDFVGASALPPSAIKFWMNVAASSTVSGVRAYIEYLARGH